MQQDALLKAIRFFGTQAALAQAIGVSPQNVNNWLNRNNIMPYEYAIVIEALTKGKIQVEQLAPDKRKANKIIKVWREQSTIKNHDQFYLSLFLIFKILFFADKNKGRIN